SSGRVQRSGNAAQIMGLGQIRLSPPANSSGGFIRTTARVCRRTKAVSASIVPRIRSPFVFMRPDSQEVWLEKTSRGEFDRTGRLIRIKGLTRDITGRKQAEKRQDLPCRARMAACR